MGEHITLAADLARTREHLEPTVAEAVARLAIRYEADVAIYEVHVQIPHVADMLAKDFGLPVAMQHVTSDGADSVEATRFALSPTVTFRDAAVSRPSG